MHFALTPAILNAYVRNRAAAKVGPHGKVAGHPEIDGPDTPRVADHAAVACTRFVRLFAVPGILIEALGAAGCSGGDPIMPPSMAETTVDAAISNGDAPAASMRQAPDADGATIDASMNPHDAVSSSPLVDAGQTATPDASSLETRDSGTADAGGAHPDADTTDGVDAGPYGWGDRTDIQEIFARYCFGCHGTTWQSCWSAQKNESTLTSVISSGTMPRNSTMSPMDKSALLAWLASGAPCAGPYQDAGNIILPGGAATPGSL